jgi:MerR family transcriptional regulator, light-induced transcriptional regulator
MILIIYPFLVRIGALWTTDAVNPSQEHFITNLIRQKLIVAIDGQFEPNRINPKKFMLFLPDGELHEISLLFCYYLVKSRGNKVIYLGQSLPLNDLYDVYQVHKPDFISSIITTTPSAEDIQAYIDQLGQKLPNVHFLLSGYQVVGQDLRLAKNMTVINQIQDLINILDELKIGRNPFAN